eukprot:s422_g27.t1
MAFQASGSGKAVAVADMAQDEVPASEEKGQEPASKAEAEEKKPLVDGPEAALDKAPASKVEAEEKSMDDGPEGPPDKASASKVCISFKSESSKALEAMAMSSLGSSARVEPVPIVPAAPVPNLYRHLAAHPRDEVSNIIQQLNELGDTVEAMQV